MSHNKLLRQALEALENCTIFACAGGAGVTATAHLEAVAALRKALEQPTVEQDSGAFFKHKEPILNKQGDVIGHKVRFVKNSLFSAPPEPEWVGLTDDQIGDALIDLPIAGNGYFLRIARAIEAALKAKNV